MDDLITRVFPGNNSAEGFFSFYESGLQDMERIYILKGGPGTGKSTLLRELSLALTDRGLAVEQWQCSSDSHSLDGVLIPALRCAVVDGTAPHTLEPKYPGVVEQLVDLGACWDRDELRRHADEIRALTGEVAALFRAAYEKLAQAGDCERERQAAAEGGSLDAVSQQLLDTVFGGERRAIRHLFSGAITPEGVVDLRWELAARAGRKIFLDGTERDCTRVLQGLVAAARRKRLAADVYHGSLLPESLMMVMLPDLDCAVVAGVAPKDNDAIVLHLPRGKESPGGEQLAAQRDAWLDQAVELIVSARRQHDQLEAYYKRAMDFDAVSALRENLLAEILHSAESAPPTA